MLAGMGGVARHQLAAAVCNSGGFGVLGMVREPVARIQREVEALRGLTQRPFAVNLIPAATERNLLKEQINACLKLDIERFVFFWEVDAELVRFLASEGKQVVHQVGGQRDADLAQAAGASVLIVQGHEAGGHVRGTTATHSLIAQIAPHCDVPVAASGGIASGRGLVSALAMGAQGVSLGTAFLVTHEANAHPHHKERVLAAGAEDTVYTTLFSRNWHEPAPVRVLQNAVTRGHCADIDPGKVIGQQDGAPVYLFSTDSPLADARGEIDLMALYCGQSCGQIEYQCSAATRVAGIIEEASRILLSPGEVQM